MKKPKQKPRSVSVDNGYGHAEHWETVTVIDSRQSTQLFSTETRESLLVQGTDGERYWVDYWQELSPAQ